MTENRCSRNGNAGLTGMNGKVCLRSCIRASRSPGSLCVASNARRAAAERRAGRGRPARLGSATRSYRWPLVAKCCAPQAWAARQLVL